MLSHTFHLLMQMLGLQAHISKCRSTSLCGLFRGLLPCRQRAVVPRDPCFPCLLGCLVSGQPLGKRVRDRAEVYLTVAFLYQQSQEAAQIPGTHPPLAFWEADSVSQPVLYLKRQTIWGEYLSYGALRYHTSYLPRCFSPIQREMQPKWWWGICSWLWLTKW